MEKLALFSREENYFKHRIKSDFETSVNFDTEFWLKSKNEIKITTAKFSIDHLY